MVAVLLYAGASNRFFRSQPTLSPSTDANSAPSPTSEATRVDAAALIAKMYVLLVTNSLTASFTNLLTDSLTNSLTHSLTHLLTHSLTHLLTQRLIQLQIHSLIH